MPIEWPKHRPTDLHSPNKDNLSRKNQFKLRHKITGKHYIPLSGYATRSIKNGKHETRRKEYRVVASGREDA